MTAEPMRTRNARMTAETPGDRDKADAAQAAAGDTEAFARLVARWQERMLGLAWRFCRDRTMAEDMAQDAFVRAYRALPRFRSDAAFGTWLTAIALEHLSQRPCGIARRCRWRCCRRTVPASSGRQVAWLERREQAETVRAQVLRLPERYRTAMVLYYFQEQDVAETARILGLRRGHVEGPAVPGPAAARAPAARARHTNP